MGEILNAFQMVTLAPGWLELPAAYAESALAKGAGHKYIKRVPKAGGGYRYFYHVGHGGGVHSEAHFVEGASFRHEGGHYHIAKVDGDKLTITHDETKESKSVTKAELGAMLAKHHEAGLKAHREKVAARLADAKANKASPKQIARLEAQAKAAGHEEKPKAAESKPEPKKMSDADAALAHFAHRKGPAMTPRPLGKWVDDVVTDMRHWKASRLSRANDPDPTTRSRWDASDAAPDGRYNWTRHIPHARPKKGDFKEAHHGGPVPVTGEVLGVWGRNGGVVTHIPTGLAVFRGTNDAAKGALAVLGTHEPNWNKGGKFADAEPAPDAELAKIRDAVMFLRENKEGLETSARVEAMARRLHSEKRATDAAADASRSVLEDAPVDPFNESVKPKSKEVAHKRAATFAAKDEEDRPSIAAVLHEKNGTAVATDGHRLAIIPSSHNPTRAELLHAKTGVTVREDYPDYTRITGAPTHVAEYNAAALRSAVAAHMANAKASGAKESVTRFGNGGAVSGSPLVPDSMRRKMVEGQKHEARLKFSGDEHNFKTNTKHLMDALEGATGTVRVGTSGPGTPIHIHREDGERHIIMPIRGD